MKVEKYDNVKQQTKQVQVQIQQLIKTNDNDNEMNIINNSMNPLKQWSNINTFNVIFDSDIDGDGYNNVLHNKVFNKINFYFISFDGDNNVYSGYLNTKIDKFDDDISDRNSFVFSLIKNGKVNNKKYFMKQGEDMAFTLFNNNLFDYLYRFGNDIVVCKLVSNKSWCNTDTHCDYKYKNDNKPLTDIIYPDTFGVQRIVVIEIN